jgi:hypothetical protein
MLTAERLRELMDYDPETGVFTRRVHAGARGRGRAGDVAGSVDDKGYIRIVVDGRRRLAHRLAWLYVTGEWPAEQIDHISGVRDDNRMCNLREATHAENCRNAKRRSGRTGFKGVVPRGNRYIARIKKGGRCIHLGTFETPEAAHAAYRLGAVEHYGEFAPAR